MTAFGNARIAKAGMADKARIECFDYRDIPRKKYDRISSLEMVEHVGIKNLPKYFAIVRDLLKDDGLFFIQFCGLRRGAGKGVPVVGLQPEDLIWGLFMNHYIFPGADASLPLSDMVKEMEKAGFSIHSTENVSIHYSVTIKRWHDNWQKNHAAILAAYGERWYRLVAPVPQRVVVAHRRAGQRRVLPGRRAQEPERLRPQGVHRQPLAVAGEAARAARAHDRAQRHGSRGVKTRRSEDQVGPLLIF